MYNLKNKFVQNNICYNLQSMPDTAVLNNSLFKMVKLIKYVIKDFR